MITLKTGLFLWHLDYNRSGLYYWDMCGHAYLKADGEENRALRDPTGEEKWDVLQEYVLLRGEIIKV